MTPEERRLDRYRRYNASLKGQRRHFRYEAAHPERKTRWAPLVRRQESAIGDPPEMGPWPDAEPA